MIPRSKVNVSFWCVIRFVVDRHDAGLISLSLCKGVSVMRRLYGLQKLLAGCPDLALGRDPGK